ncbi:hypothetical protein [Streptomyces sp. FL07-04A]|uniref:hypothetical protein n=1 Tax=Streptomyces sp. FL07-04A TaxID=3028658 RepID=UPI0029B26DF8|nr:hypothetical protein [Streptomyces sp. FL07-04A]MDX3578989.1 hypothetical protein [Streptomyces sp. FL07-04A]
MTSSLPRGRPRRPGPHISVRVAHALLGCAIGLVWLVLPGMTSGDDAPVAIKEPASAPSSVAAAVEEEDETSAADLVLPLVAVAAVGALAGYGYVRRVRRARSRTTPGGSVAGPPPPRSAQALAALDERACAALVEADDRIRATRTELDYAEALFGGESVAPLRRAVQEAGAELAAAFRMRRRYDEGTPAEEAARAHALAGIVGRCEETTRRLDSVSAALERLRGPGRGTDAALGLAEGRFRELTGLVAASETVLAGLRTRYAPTATASVIGNVEQAKDRLLFATARLNEARQASDSGQSGTAAAHLRAAEAAVAQAAVLLGGVDRLAALLKAAEQTVPAALTGAEAELSAARADPAAATAPGASQAQLRHADAVLASVRMELTAGRPGDPADMLRRIVRATEPFAPVRGGVLPAAALITARAATGMAADFVETHRGAVGAAARTRLAEAERLLAADDPADRRAADDLALESWELAGQDVRTHGNPGPAPEEATGETGAAGAVLGGIVPPGPAADVTHSGPAAPPPDGTGPPPDPAAPPGGA